MDSRLIDRLFEELDSNSAKTETLSELVYKSTAAVSLLTKLVIGVFIFIIISSIGVVTKYVVSPEVTVANIEQTTNRIIDSRTAEIQEEMIQKILIAVEKSK